MKDLFEDVEVLTRGKSLRERNLCRGLNLDMSSSQRVTDTLQLDRLDEPSHMAIPDVSSPFEYESTHPLE